MKFAHISDTHIKNLKYHYEYRIIFDQLYKKLKEERVDCIVHCGDIAHTKTQISPEFVQMCSDFFRTLADIAPTYIILGNHDGNLKNSSRQDALTPIVDALDLEDLHLLKDSGETQLNDKFCLNVLSVFDRENWIKPTDPEKINIALYHGSISNCKTDMNWTMTNGEDDLSIFDYHDFSMLGDIHRRQFLDEVGRIWYAGSTVQQNHGETNDKGILIWDIKSKDSWDIEPVVFENPKPFFTIELTMKGGMPRNLQVPTGARLRLVSNNNLPLDVMRKALDVAKHKFNPESISFLNRSAGIRGDVEDLANSLQVENLRDVNIQEELIDEYLKDYQVDADTLETVYELNRKYNKIVEEGEEISRNVNWKIKNFKWDNLFNYGEKNSVDFSSLSGIVGIFGKNFSGKSSIIDAVLYTLFNTTSKNERKNLNIINQNREYGRGVLEIEVGEKTYTIDRTSEKYTKKLKGEETLEAKTLLNFEVTDHITGETTSLNGVTRNQTDANIRKRFGTIDDFLVSSMASQHGALTFIEEGSTRRKEIIAKFLDLEQFEKKFKLSKEDSIDTRGALKKLENRNHDEELEEAKEELSIYRDALDNNEARCKVFISKIEKFEKDLTESESAIEKAPTEVIDYAEITDQLQQKNNQLVSLKAQITENQKQIVNKNELFEKIIEFVDGFDYEELLTKQNKIETINENIETHLKELSDLEREVEISEKKVKLLDGIPCSDSFPYCKFIRDANASVARLPVLEEEQANVIEKQSEAETYLSELNPEHVQGLLNKYDKLVEKRDVVSQEISEIENQLERNTSAIVIIEHEIDKLNIKAEEYNNNKEAIENFGCLLKEKRKLENSIRTNKNELKRCQTNTYELYRQVGAYEQRVESIKDAKQEYLNLRREYAAYDLFMRCMHPNGIAYDIIKKKIPVINQEIAKILTNIVDFEVFFESNGNKLDIFIKHPKHEARPIEMASGAEKTMAAMAIRLALLSVSSLPKSDLFILDEPGTALDEENMEGFIRILELIKVYFKNVLLISHLDSLKDCVDRQIVIEKKRGYARVNQ